MAQAPDDETHERVVKAARGMAVLSIACLSFGAASVISSSRHAFAQAFDRGYDRYDFHDPTELKMDRSLGYGGASGLRGSRNPCFGDAGGHGIRAPESWERPCR